ncbi:hypothetical protein KI387_031065 [Taxus chinensis]|uniref:F-box domain-containing protein n=1 Tax=Taxus chinensis TaxID=29808 RepID=A0AA38CI50_TAXCH|nr:hypothetical protein KI387_031065 [Taxus chinensis]
MDGTQMCIRSSRRQKSFSTITEPNHTEFQCAIIPGLPDDVAKHCIALLPRVHFQCLGSVCKSWRRFIQSRELYMVRKQAGTLEEWLYVLLKDSYGEGTHWQLLNSVKGKWQSLPPMPGPAKPAFGYVVMDAKLLVMAGLIEDGDGATPRASADVYEYDSGLNRWSKLASMVVARYEFACAQVDGLVYAVGGHGDHGEKLSSVEVLDPSKNKWRLIESLRSPRWGCFACGLEGKLYVMGGRSSFTIGHSRSIDVYNPKSCTWDEEKNGCVMVITHTVLDKKLFCMEWKNERKLAVYNAEEKSWKRVLVPLTGSLTVEFCFGSFNGKLFLFSSKVEPYYKTLIYDTNADPGSEWQTTHIRPLGACLCSVTIVS